MTHVKSMEPNPAAPDVIRNVTNVVFAGIGGQGVIRASDVLAAAAFAEGLDVKKAEVHGMSQRGGSVRSDVRFGSRVFSPMVPDGQADFLLVLSGDQVENNRDLLRPGGVLIDPTWVDESRLLSRKSLNVALLGVLATKLELSPDAWAKALRECFKSELHHANERAFAVGRESAVAVARESGGITP